ncbi:MAG TPA: glycosyltransferase family 2 protein, partial [Methanoculleus sp.]|nr:glycosyltransferase family 2 protein [Methanoculleus sp.]
PGLKVGFSMRRYQQFGTLKSLWEWFYIVLRGGEAGGATYTQREYK